MRVATLEQLLDTLDRLFDDGSDWTRRNPREPVADHRVDHWAELFSRPDHPLTSDLPDSNLVDWRRRGLLPGGAGRTALGLGCGLGRNTRWLARQGYAATGIDLSPYAVRHARERSPAPDSTSDAIPGPTPDPIYAECDLLREAIPGGLYDLVYDSGCFHHLPPHRRLSYRTALASCLKPGGLFGICTFAPGRMGTEADDLTLLRRGRLEGGVAYSPDDLRAVFADLEPLDGGPLPSPEAGTEPVFWMDFLNAALFRRPG
ncbi:class I SAM-dependent methyltransferase [Deinococcus koreensis]|uniref:Class I SAM-dependent methyltransferase n=1 Tax=Deinococcus koreensis TaxID=2054903 RepID=A0A2K3UUL4_9DEIO|nr:class I SAM-dependent methyltransferase [Deinococcus koreensis]PNY80224.1 class I SAM-dependent methyltransferase [Deinococcus koreensis]